MEADRWSQIEGLFQEAREVAPDEREAFLRDRCNEPAVREEVVSLLEAKDEADGFFEEMAQAAVTPALGALRDEAEGQAPSDPLDLVGKQVDHYRVEEHLGSGGMGVVYRAQDVELGRPVALKFLPPYLARSAEAEARFAREGRAASGLEHVHVATVYGTGEATVGEAEGQRYIAMAYYDGDTLSETLAQAGLLPVEEALDYTLQLAEALAAAHDAGVVHRDVKPSNVIVTEAGEVKLVDFGLAKAAGETRLTETGRPLGTTAYMSPERVEGEEAGPAADLWALGVLLYEMLAGTRPFDGGRRAAILHSILHEAPSSLDEHRDDVPPALEAVVRRCLQKNPEERYASADALLADLRAVESGGELAAHEQSSARAEGLPRVSRRWAFIAGAALLLTVGVVVGWVLWPDGGPPPVEERAVAVLPFEVTGTGAEAWRDGMVTMLSAGLDGAAGLRAVASRTVFATWERRRLSGSAATAEDALAVARDAGAEYAILGEAVSLGEDLRFSASVYRTVSGKRVGRVDVRGTSDRVTALADRLTRKVLGVLLEKSEDQVPSVDLARLTTSSLKALKVFLRGERHLRASAYEAAIEDFETAVEIDSTFALGHLQLAVARGWALEPGVGAALKQAHRFSDRLPRRERRFIQAGYIYAVEGRDYAGVDSARQLVQDYPDDPSIWYYLGDALTHGNVPGGWPEAERAFEEAVRLDPGAAPYHQHLIDFAISMRGDSARAAWRIDAHPSAEARRWYRALLDLRFGGRAERTEAWARIDTLSSSRTWLYVLHELTDWTLRGRLIEVLDAREDFEIPFSPATHNLEVGRIRAAASQFPGEWEADCKLTEHRMLGYPIPDSLFQGRLEPSTIGPDTRPDRVRCAGLYLIQQRQPEEVKPLLEHLRQLQSRSGSSPRIRTQAHQALRTLKGYRAYRAGNLRVARRHWAEFNASHDVGAIWRGDLYRTLGELDTAEGWYLAAWAHPVAHERMGELYERMDKPHKAKAAYRRFIAAWEEADPALRDRVAAARERVDALDGQTVAK